MQPEGLTVLHAPFEEWLVKGHTQPSAGACGFSAALVYPVAGILGHDAPSPQTIHPDASLLLVRVDREPDEGRVGMGEGEAQHAAAFRSRHLSLHLVSQLYGIVVGTSCLLAMGEGQGRAVTGGGEGERTIVLRAASHYPVGAAESTQQGVLVEVGTHAFPLRGPRFRSPEVHAEGHQYCRQSMGILFRAPAKDACAAGHGSSRTHTGVYQVGQRREVPVIGNLLRRDGQTEKGKDKGGKACHVHACLQ